MKAEQSQQASLVGLLPAQLQDRCRAWHPCWGFNASVTAGSAWRLCSTSI